MTAKLLTREAAAKYLGLPLRSFRRHVQPQLPCIAVGRRIMFTVEDLDLHAIASVRGGR